MKKKIQFWEKDYCDREPIPHLVRTIFNETIGPLPSSQVEMAIRLIRILTFDGNEVY